MIASNPFTPKTGWEPKAFVGRETEIGFFEKKLEEAKGGPCDHFLVLGEWGIGKTSLLREFKRITQDKGMLASMVSLREFKSSETLNDGIEHIVNEVPMQLPVNFSKLNNFTRQINAMGIQVLGTGFQLSKATKGIDPQVFFRDMLLTLWADLRTKSDVVVVLLDDIQHLSPISEIFTIMKNVLSDPKIQNETRYLFVLSSTPDGWAQFLQRHHPIGRYFTSKIRLERLTKAQIDEVVTKTLKATGVMFERKVAERIFGVTQGHPYELQTLCSTLYENQINGKVSVNVWDASLTKTLAELGDRVFESQYNEASETEKTVAKLLASSKNTLSRKEMLALAHEKDISISASTIGKSLTRLVDKGILSKDGKFTYAIPDPMFREYVKRQ